ncbi:hypothetical protein KIN20_035639 [Parelaphostrongylus tenuis]|uniref:Uncharacterized protein n=1 Tax=Parelaphostrongylus tenuis TaxID=148309 RepID=A0AAD5WKP6_PARTN|nr:hypothetical protein KIN20_035639 [Parelaphostrongylus tenuis]
MSALEIYVRVIGKKQKIAANIVVGSGSSDSNSRRFDVGWSVSGPYKVTKSRRTMWRNCRNTGALILDSCSNPAYALNQSLEFVRDMIGSSEASDYVCR